MGMDVGPEVARVFGFYAFLLENHFQRLRSATRAAQLGDYGPQGLVSDAVSCWTDTVSASLFPLSLVAPVEVRVVSPSAPVLFRVTNEDALTGGHRIAFAGGLNLVASDLVDTQPAQGSARIPAANVELTLLEGRFLVVRLKGLTALQPPLAPGKSYEGSVHPQGSPTNVASIRVDKL